MKFIIKFLYYRKVYIYFCLVAFINIFFSTENIQAKTFLITDVEISSPFEANFNKNQIIDKGFIKAFKRLNLSIVQSKDHNKISNTKIVLIKSMIETFSIKEEKFINEKYLVTLNVSFNKKKIFKFLENKNIFPSIPINKKIFFLPIILDENKEEILLYSESYLFENWNSNVKDYHLLNYILPTDDLEDFNLIKSNIKNLENYDFQNIIQKYNLNDFIISIITKNKNEIRVLNKINFNKIEKIENFNFQNLDLNKDTQLKGFINDLKNVYEDYWKSQNEINTSIKLSLNISVSNNNNIKISKFEKILNNVDLIYDFYISKFDNKNNFYKIIFNGSPDNFLKIMKDKAHEFDIQNQLWVLR